MTKAIYDYLTCSNLKVWHRKSTNEWVVEVQTVTNYTACFSRHSSKYKALAWVKTILGSPNNIKLISKGLDD